MRDQHSCPASDKEMATNKDRSIQVAVFSMLLILYPAQLTLTELIREIAADPGDFGERDGVERAVKDLVGAGLLHRHGPFVVLSRSAVRASELLGVP